MLCETVFAAPSQWTTDLLVLITDRNSQLFDLQDEDLQARVAGLQTEFANDELSSQYIFEPRHRQDIGAIMVFSTEMGKGVSLDENAKTFVYKAVKYAASSNRKHVLVALNTPEGTSLVSKAAEGACMAPWAFDRYKKDAKDKYADITVSFACLEQDGVEQALEQGQIFAKAVNNARNLIAEPSDVITPEALAGIAKDLSERAGFEYQEWNTERLADEGFNGLIKVGGGSSFEPRMFTMTYTPEEPCSEHLVIVGKGLTFDSGGISLKPASNMHEMKGDMGGAAAVIGTMQILAKLHPSIKVTGLVVSAENMPDAKSQRPGDIIVYKNGKSVHVENTDAEGRLVLADGLIHAGEIGATHIIDIATLTGGCWRALGESFTGIMGTNRALVNAITQAGGNQGEAFWKLPLPIEYREMLKTPYADMTNSAGPIGAALTAGLFLKEFVPEDTGWAHLDIAGTSWRAKAWKYYAEGPIGVGVRTLAELAWHWHDYVK